MKIIFLSLLLFVSAAVSQDFGSAENCTSPSSKWENLQFCPIATQPQKYQKLCLPKRLYPTSANLSGGRMLVKGVITMYHGFTACPDAFKEIADLMVSQGYIVIVPLLPGQGINLGYNCQSSPGQCVAQGTNPSEIPVSRDGYFTWSQTIIDITKQEASRVPAALKSDDFKVMALGLSVGAALALYSVEVKDSPFNRVLTVNPYLSTGTASLDFSVYNCTISSDPDSCISFKILNQVYDHQKDGVTTENSTSTGSISLHTLLEASKTVTKGLNVWLVKNSAGRILTESYDRFLTSTWELLAAVGDAPVIMDDKVFDTEMGWGESCFSNTDRGGICAFRIRNIISLHAFVEYVVGNIDSVPETVEYANINSDMDGASRDSVSLAVLESLRKRGLKTSRCRFKTLCNPQEIIQSQFKGDNFCGVPHSCFSRAEALFNEPHNNYWQESLLSTTSAFLNSTTQSRSIIGVAVGDKSKCVTSATGISIEKGKTEFADIGGKYVVNARKRYGITNNDGIFSKLIGGFQ